MLPRSDMHIFSSAALDGGGGGATGTLEVDDKADEKAIKKAVATDKRIPRHYDPSWIASPAGETIKKNAPLLPRSEWSKIDSQSRELYIRKHEQKERMIEELKRSFKGRTSNSQLGQLGHPFN